MNYRRIILCLFALFTRVESVRFLATSGEIHALLAHLQTPDGTTCEQAYRQIDASGVPYIVAIIAPNGIRLDRAIDADHELYGDHNVLVYKKTPLEILTQAHQEGKIQIERGDYCSVRLTMRRLVFELEIHNLCKEPESISELIEFARNNLGDIYLLSPDQGPHPVTFFSKKVEYYDYLSHCLTCLLFASREHNLGFGIVHGVMGFKDHAIFAEFAEYLIGLMLFSKRIKEPCFVIDLLESFGEHPAVHDFLLFLARHDVLSDEEYEYGKKLISPLPKCLSLEREFGLRLTDGNSCHAPALAESIEAAAERVGDPLTDEERQVLYLGLKE